MLLSTIGTITSHYNDPYQPTQDFMVHVSHGCVLYGAQMRVELEVSGWTVSPFFLAEKIIPPRTEVNLFLLAVICALGRRKLDFCQPS